MTGTKQIDDSRRKFLKNGAKLAVGLVALSPFAKARGLLGKYFEGVDKSYDISRNKQRIFNEIDRYVKELIAVPDAEQRLKAGARAFIAWAYDTKQYNLNLREMPEEYDKQADWIKQKKRDASTNTILAVDEGVFGSKEFYYIVSLNKNGKARLEYSRNENILKTRDGNEAYTDMDIIARVYFLPTDVLGWKNMEANKDKLKAIISKDGQKPDNYELYERPATNTLIALEKVG